MAEHDADPTGDRQAEELIIRVIGPIIRPDGTISSPVVGGIKRLAPLADTRSLRARQEEPGREWDGEDCEGP